MNTSELDYELPPELIAQRPAANRDESRLLVAQRGGGEPHHRRFRDLPEELPQGTLVVVNDTRVVPARIVTWNVLPSPGTPELSTHTVPPISSASRLLIASPKPVPP